MQLQTKWIPGLWPRLSAIIICICKHVCINLLLLEVTYTMYRPDHHARRSLWPLIDWASTLYKHKLQCVYKITTATPLIEVLIKCSWCKLCLAIIYFPLFSHFPSLDLSKRKVTILCVVSLLCPFGCFQLYQRHHGHRNYCSGVHCPRYYLFQQSSGVRNETTIQLVIAPFHSQYL